MRNSVLINNHSAVPLLLKRSHTSYKGFLYLDNSTLGNLMKEKDTFLNEREDHYLKTLSYPQRQKSYLLGRFTAKHAVAALTGETDLKQIGITWGVFQQPVVEHKVGNIQVSIAHTDDCGIALAFPEAHPLGIDLEKATESRVEAIKGYLTAPERQESQKLNLSPKVSCIMLWTIKEALSKALKTGLMTDFRLYEVFKIEECMEAHQQWVECEFKNFAQYRAISWFFQDMVCSFVLPKKTVVEVSALLSQIVTPEGNEISL